MSQRREVIIQQDVPDDKSVYHVIDSVELDENNFWKGKIFLVKT